MFSTISKLKKCGKILFSCFGNFILFINEPIELHVKLLGDMPSSSPAVLWTLYSALYSANMHGLPIKLAKIIHKLIFVSYVL